MKKLLKVSLMAMLVAAPFAARAEGEPMDAGTAPFAGVDATAVADVASTSYVKGAYNDVIGKINKVATTAAAGQTAQQVEDAIDGAAGAGIATDGSGHLSVDLTSNGGLEFTGTGDAQTVGVKVDGTHVIKDSTTGAVTLSTTDIANLTAASTALQANEITTGSTAGTISVDGTDVAVKDVLTTASTLDGSKLSAGTVAETALAQAVQDKLAAADSALQDSDLDGTTIEVDGTSNKVQVKAGSIGTTQLASGVVTSLGKADTALQNDSALNGANLTAGTVAETALDSATQTKLNNAAAAKYVTVHTTWGSDSTTASANVLTTTAPASGS
jgi:hypothetical protein